MDPFPAKIAEGVEGRWERKEGGTDVFYICRFAFISSHLIFPVPLLLLLFGGGTLFPAPAPRAPAMRQETGPDMNGDST